MPFTPAVVILSNSVASKPISIPDCFAYCSSAALIEPPGISYVLFLIFEIVFDTRSTVSSIPEERPTTFSKVSALTTSSNEAAKDLPDRAITTNPNNTDEKNKFLVRLFFE